MMRMGMSQAAAALLRALIARSGVDRERILLSDTLSSDWRSLTFTGERHHLSLRVSGGDSAKIVERICMGLEEAEFSIPGILVADIALVGTPVRTADGATEVTIEALTVSAD